MGAYFLNNKYCMRFFHLKYQIDKVYWRNLFYNNINHDQGRWHDSAVESQNLYWFQRFIQDDDPLKEESLKVEKDLNIVGLNNFPRFSYQFRGSLLRHHVDEDNMVSININLFDTIPVIHLEHQPHSYECAFIDVGDIRHGVQPDTNDRLILKYCIRHPWKEVYDRLDAAGLIFK